MVSLEDRYAVTNQDIELICTISQLMSTVLVQWKDSNGQIITDDSHYKVDQGSKDENGNQQSTLKIFTAKLKALGTTTVTFSCEVLSGDQTVAIAKTMTLTLYDFSKYFFRTIW